MATRSWTEVGWWQKGLDRFESGEWRRDGAKEEREDRELDGREAVLEERLTFRACLGGHVSNNQRSSGGDLWREERQADRWMPVL